MKRAAIVLLLILTLSVSTLVVAGQESIGIFVPAVYQQYQDLPASTSTPTQVSSPNPTATPTSTATENPSGVTISNTYSYVDSIDYLHVLGEVQNDTSYFIRFVGINADFYNTSGQLVDTSLTFTFLDVIPPGDRACFDLIEKLPAAYSHYVFYPADYWTDGTPPPPLNISSLSGSYDPTYHWYKILGMIQNPGPVRVEYVEAISTLYNASGQVLDCGLSFVTTTHLDPGQTSSFEITSSGIDGASVANYRVQASGIPE